MSAAVSPAGSLARRLVIWYLQNHPNNAVAFEALVEYVRKHHSEQRDSDRVALRLHHIHVPKLEDCGLLEYDTRSKTIRYYPGSDVENLLGGIMELVGE